MYGCICSIWSLLIALEWFKQKKQNKNKKTKQNKTKQKKKKKTKNKTKQKKSNIWSLLKDIELTYFSTCIRKGKSYRIGWKFRLTCMSCGEIEFISWFLIKNNNVIIKNNNNNINKEKNASCIYYPFVLIICIFCHFFTSITNIYLDIGVPMRIEYYWSDVYSLKLISINFVPFSTVWMLNHHRFFLLTHRHIICLCLTCVDCGSWLQGYCHFTSPFLSTHCTFC